jgi:hypothetical protein
MENNPTTKDFLSLLPLSLTLEDYNRTEKISDLPKRLSLDNAPAGYKPAAGDITIYAPWGNLAIFYKSFSYSNGLILLGKIESNVEALSVGFYQGDHGINRIMRTRLLNRQSIRSGKVKPVCEAQPCSFYRIYFVENESGASIQLLQAAVMLNNDCNKVQNSFLLSFDQCALPWNHWPPFTRISQDGCEPLLLSEAQANEFKSLFERITIELGTDYVFKNEYLVSLLKIIILLMDKISQQHAGA